jgi:glycosyltransferase involved in cell wall biosynthesis
MTPDQALAETYGRDAPALFDRLGALSEVGAHAGVTRYLYDLYTRRPDLRDLYPNVDGDGAHGLVEWAYRYRAQEEPVHHRLLGTRWLSEPAGPGAAAGVFRYLDHLYARNPDLQRDFPDIGGADGPRLVEWARTIGIEHDPVLRVLLAGDAPRSPCRHPPPSAPGVNAIGLLRGELGLGEAARLAIMALDSATVPVLPIAHALDSSRNEHAFSDVRIAEAALGANLVCLNPDQHWRLLRDSRADYPGDRYTIGFWWWELAGALPVEWHIGFELVDEVWVGSDHTAAAIRAAAPVPVTKVGIPVVPGPVPARTRSALGLPDGFLFLTMFDYNSTVERKNPLAAIEAFKAAFPPGSGAALAVKSVNAARHPEKRAAIEAASAAHPDVHLIDGYVSAPDKNAMLAACDAYVSLHRAEGFGLPIAEAMHLGKPAIATAYSGNLEFMTPHNSYLVGHTMTGVGRAAEPYYPADGEWAEPDVEEAARAMCSVFDDRDEARRRGRLAAETIRRDFSPEAVGRTMKARLDELRTDPAPAADLAAELAAFDRALGTGHGHGRIRRVLLRLMRPYTFHRRRLDERLVEALDELRAEQRRLELQHALARAELLSELRRRDARITALEAAA